MVQPDPASTCYLLSYAEPAGQSRASVSEGAALTLDGHLGYNCSVMTGEKVTIKIPRELYRSLSEMIKDTGFSSVNEFIVFVMRTLASSGEIKSENRLTAEEVRAVRERLKRLGYLKEEE